MSYIPPVEAYQAPEDRDARAAFMQAEKVYCNPQSTPEQRGQAAGVMRSLGHVGCVEFTREKEPGS
jgi:hypothetical protein